MQPNNIFRLIFFSYILCIAGCSHTASYDSSYVKERVIPFSEKIGGKAFVFMDKEDKAYIFKGKPTRYSGAATTLNIPLGEITENITIKVFNTLFAHGVHLTKPDPDNKDYTIFVKPKVTYFEYAYNQSKNLGFAITPQARVSLQLLIMDNTNKELVNRVYDSDMVDGEAYFMSARPGNEISKLTHNVILKLIEQAINDLRKILQS